WTSAGWSAKFALPFDDKASGFGQSSQEVGAVRVSGDLLLGYYDSVHERTIDYLKGLGEADLDRIVDTRFTPAVTLGVRLVSILSDELQHAGQAAYVRGIIERRR
ncbi:MAG: DinB family protein, partial [Actinomycetota bacterium]